MWMECLLQLKSVLAQQGSSSSSPAPAPRTPPGSAKEGADLVQPGSSSSSPAPAPRTPPGGANEGADLFQQGSSSCSPAPAPCLMQTPHCAKSSSCMQAGIAIHSYPPLSGLVFCVQGHF